MLIISYFVVKINLLQKTIDMHNFYAKIQKPSEMAKFNLTFPRCSIFTSKASKVRKIS